MDGMLGIILCQTTSYGIIFCLASILWTKKQNTHNQNNLNKRETTAKPTNPELEKPLKETIASAGLEKKNQKGTRRAVVIPRLKEMSYENKLENYVPK